MLSHYVVIVEVCLQPPLKADEDTMVVGYFRNFGVSAASEHHAQKFIRAEVNDGKIDWEKAEWRTFGPAEEEDPDIRRAFERSKAEGIWYRSGRAFYPADE